MIMHQLLRPWLLFMTLVLAITNRSMAGGDSDTRAVGLARSGMALSDHTEAFYWNPANLGFNNPAKKKPLVVDIFSFGFRMANNVIGISEYNKYNGKTWTRNDKQDILKLFGSDDHLDFNMEGEARIGVRYMNYSLNIYSESYGFARAPKSLFEMALSPDGYRVGGERLDARASGSGQTGITFAASAGYSVKKWVPIKFDDVTVGLTAKYIRGLYQGTLKEAWIVIEESDTLTTRGRYNMLTSQGGHGFGFDLGLAARINKKWSVGLSFQNLVSAFSWNGKNEKSYGSYETKTNNLIDIKDNTTNDSSGTVKAKAYGTYYPILIRAGVAYLWRKDIVLVGQVEHFFRTKYVGDPSPRVAVGAEFQKWKHVALRTGMSLGGDNRGFNIAGGAGFLFGQWIIDIGTNNLEGIVLLRRFSFSTNVRLMIR